MREASKAVIYGDSKLAERIVITYLAKHPNKSLRQMEKATGYNQADVLNILGNFDDDGLVSSSFHRGQTRYSINMDRAREYYNLLRTVLKSK